MDIPLHLHITPAEGAPFEHPLRGDSLVVGRALDADLTLSDPFASRRHSRLFRTGGELFIEDLGSRNGTLVNGQAIQQPTRVGPGDVIKISNSLIRIAAEAAAPVRPPEPEDDFLDGTVFRRASDLLDRQSAPAAGEKDLRRYAGRLKILNEVHQALGRSLTLEELLELILDRVFDHLRPDRGAILLKGKDGGYQPASQGPSREGSVQWFRYGRRATTVERVLEVEQARRLAYTVVRGLPVRNYRAEVTLTPVTPAGTAVRWTATWDGTLAGRLVHRRLQQIYRQVMTSLIAAADHQDAPGKGK